MSKHREPDVAVANHGLSGLSHGHSHGPHESDVHLERTPRLIVMCALGLFAGLTLTLIVLLWPSAFHTAIPAPLQDGTGNAVKTASGTVIDSSVGACPSNSAGRVFPGDPQPVTKALYSCARHVVELNDGPDAGHHTLLELAGPGQPNLAVGDSIKVQRAVEPGGETLYGFFDYSRGVPLTLAVIIFAAVVVAVARWKGLRALAGLGVAGAVIVGFMLPALLDNKPPLLTALTTGSVILFAVLYLAHGVSYRTSAALLGTLSAMLLSGLMSVVVIGFTRLTGFSEESMTQVRTYLPNVNLTGLILAGFIIGSLGVLNDVTITQASAAFEIAEADPAASRREVFAASMRVGRDHIASTVYTLVLAYAGGALPLLLLFSISGRSISDLLFGDAIAIEIARAAVGGIALTLAVPLTTLIAVLLARANKGVAHGVAR